MKTPDGFSGENNQEGPGSKKPNYAKLIKDYHSMPATDDYNLFRKRNAAIQIIQESGFGGVFVSMSGKTAGKNGVEAAGDASFVKMVAENRRIEDEILSGKDPSLIVIPKAYKLRGDADISLQKRIGSSLHTFDKGGNLEIDNKYLIDVQGSPLQKGESNPAQDAEEVLARAQAALAKPGFARDAVDLVYLQKAKQMGLHLEVESTDTQVAVESVNVATELKSRVEEEGIAARAKQERGELLTSVEREAIRHAEQKQEEVKQQAVAEESAKKAHEEAMNSVRVNDGDVEAQKAEWLKNHPEEAAKDEAERAVAKAKLVAQQAAPVSTSSPENRVHPPSVDINLTEMESDASRNLQTVDIDLAQMEKDASKKMENITKVLEVRKEQSRSRLEKWGIGIKKGLDYYRGMKPRNKLLLGVALAGASVATGGALSVVAKGLSAGSYGAGFYDKMLKAEQDKGNNPNKSFLVARSALYGTVLALGTSALFSELASHVHIDTEGIANAASEKFSAMKEGLKSFFWGSPDVVVPNGLLHDFPASSALHDVPAATEYGPSVWVDQPVIIQPDGLLHDVAPPEARVPDTVIEPAPVSEPSSAQPESFTPPAEHIYSAPQSSPDILAAMTPINVNDVYTMQPGDSTSSILQRVLATIPESQTMSVDEKAALVTKLTKEWLTPVGSITSPNWALKEMMTGLPGTQVHHLNHVRDAFNILIERANPIKN